MTLKRELQKLLAAEPLTATEMEAAISSFMLPEEVSGIGDAEIAAFLALSATRVPTADELFGAARALRTCMIPVPNEIEEVLADSCGTGGSGLPSFNTSTLAALVCAGAGQKIAKHGNRGATSPSGSADLLEALGVRLALSPEDISLCLRETNFCFMFAPRHHPATKRVQQIRKALGFRTIFNFIGPLVNPAGVDVQLLGVSDGRMLDTIAATLGLLGSSRAMVVHGHDGLDEISLTTETDAVELGPQGVRRRLIAPEDYGFTRVSRQEIQGFPPEQSAEQAWKLLQGEQSAYRDIVLLNAGFLLYLTGHAATEASGIAQAIEAIDSGQARKVLESVRAFTVAHASEN